MRKFVRINELMEEARQLYELGKWRAALRAYNEAIRLEHRDERLYFARGYLYFKLAVYFRAIEDLTSVLAINRRFSTGQVYELRGSAYFEVGDYKNTISDLTKAIESVPESADARLKRGISYMKTGRHKEAIADFEALLRHDRYEKAASVALGECYAELGQYVRAVEHYSRFASLDVSSAWIYLKRAEVYERSGDMCAAMLDYTGLVGFYTDLIKDSPAQGWLYAARGLVLERMGRPRDSKEDYRRADQLSGYLN